MHSELMPLAFRLHSWMECAPSSHLTALRMHSGFIAKCIQNVWMSNPLQEAYRMHAILHAESMLQSNQKTCQHPPESLPECSQRPCQSAFRIEGRAALRMHPGMHSEIPAQMHSAIHVKIQSQDIPKWTQGPCQNAVRSHASMLSESRSICSQSAFWNVLRIHGWMHLGF